MSILITTHPASLPATTHLLHRITATPDAEWAIDNKYYTARVPLRVHVFSGDDDDEQVDLGDALAVIYAFTSTETASPPPPLVAALTLANPDLTFHIRLPSSSSSSSSEAFDPIKDEETGSSVFGEYINLSGLTFDDPSSELNDLRDSLQTVPWPSMVRKPLPRGPTNPPIGRAPAGRDFFGGTREDRMLDAWLDDDDDDDGFQKGGEDGFSSNARTSHEGETFEDDFHPDRASAGSPPSPSPTSEEYTPFQCGPTSHPYPTAIKQDDNDDDDESFLPADPTPLLAHLNDVRHRLSTIPDPDARRTIAAREVERLFAGLGIDLRED